MSRKKKEETILSEKINLLPYKKKAKNAKYNYHLNIKSNYEGLIFLRHSGR